MSLEKLPQCHKMSYDTRYHIKCSVWVMLQFLIFYCSCHMALVHCLGPLHATWKLLRHQLRWMNHEARTPRLVGAKWTTIKMIQGAQCMVLYTQLLLAPSSIKIMRFMFMSLFTTLIQNTGKIKYIHKWNW